MHSPGAKLNEELTAMQMRLFLPEIATGVAVKATPERGGARFPQRSRWPVLHSATDDLLVHAISTCDPHRRNPHHLPTELLGNRDELSCRCR
jgi:hypothetical protein